MGESWLDIGHFPTIYSVCWSKIFDVFRQNVSPSKTLTILVPRVYELFLVLTVDGRDCEPFAASLEASGLLGWGVFTSNLLLFCKQGTT